MSAPVTDADLVAGVREALAGGRLALGRGAVADFNREAPSLVHAITSAVRDIEKVPGLRCIQCHNMVNLAGIAQRTGVSREAVRLRACAPTTCPSGLSTSPRGRA